MVAITNSTMSLISCSKMLTKTLLMLALLEGPAPAIPRLGIKPYQWGTECLSGDVLAGPATSFPQAIGMVIYSTNIKF